MWKEHINCVNTSVDSLIWIILKSRKHYQLIVFLKLFRTCKWYNNETIQHFKLGRKVTLWADIGGGSVSVAEVPDYPGTNYKVMMAGDTKDAA